MIKKDAVKAALAVCESEQQRRDFVLVPAWKNGFFGGDPFSWAILAREIKADMTEVMSARYHAFFKHNPTKEVIK